MRSLLSKEGPSVKDGKLSVIGIGTEGDIEGRSKGDIDKQVGQIVVGHI